MSSSAEILAPPGTVGRPSPSSQITAPPEDQTGVNMAGDSQRDRLGALAFLVDDATEAALRGGLVEHLGHLQIRRGGIRAACRALKHEASPRFLLVDISDVDGDPVEALNALAAVCTPDMKVLVLGQRADIEFYRLITRQLGVDDYLRKPLTRDGVSSMILPYIAGADPQQKQNKAGRVVVVCGARGGAGATTIATSLALQVSEQTRGHVAVLDLHLRGGNAAMLLGVSAGTGLRVGLENPDRVDGLFLERAAIPAGDRLRVIAAEEPFDTEPAPTVAGVNRLFELLRQRFNHIIVDLPTPPSGPEREALLIARQALVVLTPDVGNLRDAQQTRRLINGLIGAGRVIVVLNRANMPGGLKADLVEQGLGIRPEVTIPDIPKQLLQAANLGRPALSSSPTLRRALSPLTQEISGIQQQPGTSGFLARLRRK